MRLLLISFLLIFIGCSSRPTVSEHQCRAGDWQTVGLRDGSQGLPSTQILRHQEACGVFGIYPSRETYMAGWNEGLSQYCTAENAFELGARGAGHHSVCNNSEFNTAYQDGRALYHARQEVVQIENQLAAAEQRLIDIREEKIEVSAAQLSSDLTVEQRFELLAQLDKLHAERHRVRNSIPQLEEELQASLDRLDALSHDLAFAN